MSCHKSRYILDQMLRYLKKDPSIEGQNDRLTCKSDSDTHLHLLPESSALDLS